MRNNSKRKAKRNSQDSNSGEPTANSSRMENDENILSSDQFEEITKNIKNSLTRNLAMISFEYSSHKLKSIKDVELSKLSSRSLKLIRLVSFRPCSSASSISLLGKLGRKKGRSCFLGKFLPCLSIASKMASSFSKFLETSISNPSL